MPCEVSPGASTRVPMSQSSPGGRPGRVAVIRDAQRAGRAVVYIQAVDKAAKTRVERETACFCCVWCGLHPSWWLEGRRTERVQRCLLGTLLGRYWGRVLGTVNRCGASWAMLDRPKKKKVAASATTTSASRGGGGSSDGGGGREWGDDDEGVLHIAWDCRGDGAEGTRRMCHTTAHTGPWTPFASINTFTHSLCPTQPRGVCCGARCEERGCFARCHITVHPFCRVP